MSHEWIYQHIYKDKKNGGKLYENLRQKRKYRKKRLLTKDKRGVIPNKVMIADRPPEVETRERYGDWEGDTIIGANHQGAILTLIERKSRFTYIEKLDGKTAKSVENAHSTSEKSSLVLKYSTVLIIAEVSITICMYVCMYPRTVKSHSFPVRG